MVIVVVLAMSIITSIISSVVALVLVAIIPTITPVVVTPVVAVIATVVVTFVIAAVITSIVVLVAWIGPAITVISSIRSTVTVVETLATIPVVVVVASGPLGGKWDSRGVLQLLALPHGVLSITVKLALVVHDHVEVTYEEGGRSWWIRHIGFSRSLARPGASIVVVFSVEVVHHRILSVDQLFDIGHEITDGVCVSFVDLLE
jgi:hypothetical protein